MPRVNKRAVPVILALQQQVNKSFKRACDTPVTLKINGETVDADIKHGYMTVDRTSKKRACLCVCVD